MKEIFLVRHAQSEANEGKRTVDNTGIDLTEKGRESAEVFSDSLKTFPKLIITSPYKRSIETAKPIIKRFSGVKIMHLPDFGPMINLSPRKFNGTNRIERALSVSEYWKKEDALLRDDDDSETFEEFFWRVKCGLYFLSKVNASRIIVITHGHFIQLSLLIIDDLNASPNKLIVGFNETWQTSPIPHLNITKIEF